ncbi:3-deoxy-D-manno-octulosonic acid transferase [Teichococcus oryzae]|uniref:3-deoxy-D-manno-octulosonic acid transferase n=1 Tax=Teichococcus oryzae TaxID=1608942 RepID=A0A5B2TJF0_9PROT|nr:3-deoxy-D-manno-octulosonic acid transferase [Pseudoroseomonas oryzae]KAA2214626.1 3-deoxy-D-manno-octulosonic acid transferase [Pseudoroseomonas oryzae]
MSLAATAGRVAGQALAPVLPFWLKLRARRGKEIPERLAERRGLDAARPEGPLIWLHGASVGESLSLIPLMAALVDARPELRLLVTTGTVTSAALLAQRLAPALRERVIHRFVPLDVPRWAATFLDGWRPDAAVFVESELWPNILAALAERNIPAALVNARLSPRSARAWRWAPGLARRMLGSYRLVVAQSEEDAARLRALGAVDAACWGHLKAAAEPPPADPAALAALRRAVGRRPVFLAASTHPGEEAAALAAHRLARASLPDLLTVIVPRHPQRGEEVAELIAPLPFARRSQGALPAPEHDIYLADTLGELGLFFRLAGVALVGATLVPKGGHNPLEPARLRCPILLGPHTGHVEAMAAALVDGGGALRVTDAATLAEAITIVLTDSGRAKAMADAAAKIATDASQLPARLAAAILDWLPQPPFR